MFIQAQQLLQRYQNNQFTENETMELWMLGNDIQNMFLTGTIMDYWNEQARSMEDNYDLMGLCNGRNE